MWSVNGYKYITHGQSTYIGREIKQHSKDKCCITKAWQASVNNRIHLPTTHHTKRELTTHYLPNSGQPTHPTIPIGGATSIQDVTMYCGNIPDLSALLTYYP